MSPTRGAHPTCPERPRDFACGTRYTGGDIRAMKPRIAIPVPTSSNHKYAERVLPQYRQAVEQAGGEVEIIPLDLPNQAIADLGKRCHGVLLPGSPADVDPEKYGAVKHEKTAVADALRDNADELLLQDAYNLRKPVLGICYGVQSLNVWRSGTLVQHLESPVNHNAGRTVARAHSVTVDPLSHLARILKNTWPERAGSLAGFVNSSHHQALNTPGDGLRVVARSEDGVVEAVEGTAPDQFVLGVQWHPERMSEDESARAIFRALVEAARQRLEHPRTPVPDFEALPR